MTTAPPDQGPGRGDRREPLPGPWMPLILEDLDAIPAEWLPEWLALLRQAHDLYPGAPMLPRSTPDPLVRLLVDSGRMTVLPGDRYRCTVADIHGQNRAKDRQEWRDRKRLYRGSVPQDVPPDVPQDVPRDIRREVSQSDSHLSISVSRREEVQEGRGDDGYDQDDARQILEWLAKATRSRLTTSPGMVAQVLEDLRRHDWDPTTEAYRQAIDGGAGTAGQVLKAARLAR